MTLLDPNLQYHLNVRADDVGKYVILPGDPGRVPLIANYLDKAVPVASNREYTTYTGYLAGEKVSVVSTGIGGPSAAIALEELVKCGAHTFIRVGTSGGIDLKVSGGDLVVACASVRAEGTSHEYLPAGYPAVADFAVTSALAKTAAQLSENADGHRYHIGVVQSKDSFYGEADPQTMPVAQCLTERWDAYVRCGCLASEMETAALFSVGITRGVRVGAVLTALWNVERAKAGLADLVCKSSDRAIRCAVGAIRELIDRMDA